MVKPALSPLFPLDGPFRVRVYINNIVVYYTSKYKYYIIFHIYWIVAMYIFTDASVPCFLVDIYKYRLCYVLYYPLHLRDNSSAGKSSAHFIYSRAHWSFFIWIKERYNASIPIQSHAIYSIKFIGFPVHHNMTNNAPFVMFSEKCTLINIIGLWIIFIWDYLYFVINNLFIFKKIINMNS